MRSFTTIANLITSTHNKPKGLNPMKTYILATESNNGTIAHLDLAPMFRNQAEGHAKKLRALMPNAPVYVINLNAE